MLPPSSFPIYGILLSSKVSGTLLSEGCDRLVEVMGIHHVIHKAVLLKIGRDSSILSQENKTKTQQI